MQIWAEEGVQSKLFPVILQQNKKNCQAAETTYEVGIAMFLFCFECMLTENEESMVASVMMLKKKIINC